MKIAPSRPLRFLIIALLVAVVYWPAGFYPFSPLREHTNGALTEPTGALAFPAPGLGLSNQAPHWLRGALERNAMEVKLELRTSDTEQEEACIFSLADDTGESYFSLGQNKEHLVVRWRSPALTGTRLRSAYVGKVFNSPNWKELHVHLDHETLRVSVNGKVAAQRPVGPNPFPAWQPQARVTVGNRIEFHEPWRGEFRSLLAGSGEQWDDLLAPGALAFPSPYTFVSSDRTRHLFSLVSLTPTRAIIKDWIINTLGFIPLGALIVLSFPGRLRVLTATAACLAVSLTIELTQIYLPWRVPSLQDLLLNTVGGLIGAVLAGAWLRLARSRKLGREAAAR